MSIRIQGVSKDFNGFKALNKVDLQVDQGEILALLGSSGCGKTTLLKIIAGLIDQTEGKIWLKDEDITNWPAQERNTAMVFQNYALFPHMNLEDNIGYGLKIRRMGKKEIKKRVDNALEQVCLDGLNKRKIQALSGGQKQRAALARALVTQPDVLLFDEPLSNLDEKLRVSMRKEIRRIQQETGITSIYVTHDQKEAMAIADKIAVMNEGEIMQWGKPEEVFRSPANAFTADFMGHVNVFKLSTNNETLKFLDKAVSVDTAKKYVYILLPPEEVDIISANNGKLPEAVIEDYELSGNMIRYRLRTQDLVLYADKFLRMKDGMYSKGQKVYVDFDAKTLHLFY